MKRFLIQSKPIRLGRWGKQDWLKVDQANMDSCYKTGYINTPNILKYQPNDPQSSPTLCKRRFRKENTV
jgi:hypothetical protein